MLTQQSSKLKNYASVLTQTSLVLKDYAEVLPLFLLTKTWLNLGKGHFYIPSITEGKLETVKMKTVILALISIIILSLLAEILIPHQYQDCFTHIHHSHKMLHQIRPLKIIEN